MLSAVLDYQREYQRVADAGLTDIRRAHRRGGRAAADMLGQYQRKAVVLAAGSVDGILAEQNIPTDSVGDIQPQALLTGTAAGPMFDSTSTSAAFDQLALTFLADAARDAMAVTGATRPAVKAYVRVVSAPCCSRCAVLAGRLYHTPGFQRHPRCDCQNVPTNQGHGRGLVTNPDALFRSGQITGLSRADTKALNAGADLGRLVNVRRKAAGLIDGSSVMVRAGRPTPAFIFKVASDRTDAVEMLRRYGYVT